MPFINVSPFHEFLSGMNFILQINVGVVKLTGATGTGKTTLLQELVRSTTHTQQDIVVFDSAPSSMEQIKETIREQLALNSSLNFHDALLNYLLAKPYEQRRLIVVFDEAEHMDEQTLLAAGHLRSIQHGGHHLIGMVLCGRPELTRILKNPEHRLLAKDILLSYELSPLSSQQLPDFCRACLATRGLDNFVLVSDDYLQIMQKSGGLPGKVAELVETYWPEDPENLGPAALSIHEPPVFEPAQMQQQFGNQNPAAAMQPEICMRPEPGDLSFDVSPVVTPDIAAMMAHDDVSQVTLIEGAGFSLDASDTLQSGIVATTTSAGSYDVSASASFDAPSGTQQNTPNDSSSVVTSDISAVDEPHVVPDISSDVTSAFSSDVSFDAPSDTTPAASFDPSSEVPGNESFEITFDVSYRVIYETSSDAVDDYSGDGSSDVAPEVQSATRETVSSEDVPAAPIEPVIAESPTSAVAVVESVESSIEPAMVEPSIEPVVELAIEPVAEPSVEPAGPNVVAFTAPAVAAPITITKRRAIVGSLFAASAVIIIALVYMRGLDPGSVATPEVANVEPARTAPAQASTNVNVPAVAVQQFGNPPAAETTVTPAPAPTVAPTEVVPQPLATQTPANTTTGPDVDAADTAPATTDVAPQNPLVAASPTSPAAIATVAQSVVTAWINAWQSQNVAAYLAFYHPEFVPPSTATRAAWESNRTRTITRQSSISINMEDFRVVNNSANQTTVQFMLTYRGDSYADHTLKELVLQPDASGELRILKEQNLQTEVFDPVIEAASSWMRDRTPEEMAITARDNNEPVVSELESDDAILLAASSNDTPVSSAPVTEAPVSAVSAVSAAEPVFQTAATATIPLTFNMTSLTQREVQQISGFLSQWADAWQNQETGRYLGHYHPDYKAPELATTAAWREERERKITTPASISISLEELEIIENNANNILVELLMVYLADDYADRTLKRMLLTKSAGGLWQITMEKNLEVEKL